MSDYFAKRLDVLGQRKKSLDSRGIQYQRSGFPAFIITNATHQKNRQEEMMPNGNVLEVDSHDFVIDSDDLSSEIGEPVEGDKIWLATLDADGMLLSLEEKFEVMPRDGGQCFRYTTVTKKRIRIHAREVNDVDSH